MKTQNLSIKSGQDKALIFTKIIKHCFEIHFQRNDTRSINKQEVLINDIRSINKLLTTI